MTGDRKTDVAVVGGGLTGLAAAARLSAAGRSVHLLEAAPRLGGCLHTWRRNGWTFELGPNTVVADGELSDLFAAAGLADDLLVADRAAGRRYLWSAAGRLEALPRHPLGILRSPLLSLGGKLRLLGEPFVRRGERPAADESVAAFARRRLGSETLETLVGPLVSGIWAGDPERLSLDHAFPRLAELERRHGSLLRGMIRSRREAAATPAADGRRLLGLAGGFASLAARLADRVRQHGGVVDAGRPCRALRRATGGLGIAGDLRVETDAGTVSARRVILAVPARRAAELLARAGAGRGEALAAVPHAPVAVVCLGFRRADVDHPLDGFGFLAPRGRGLRILGCLWTSSIFPRRAPDDHVALTALAGGRTDPAAVDLADDRLLATVLADLDRTVGLTGEPVIRHVHRWRPGIPQYEVGHARFVGAASEIEQRLPGAILAGSYLGGVSVADRAREARRAAERALEN